MKKNIFVLLLIILLAKFVYTQLNANVFEHVYNNDISSKSTDSLALNHSNTILINQIMVTNSLIEVDKYTLADRKLFKSVRCHPLLNIFEDDIRITNHVEWYKNNDLSKSINKFQYNDTQQSVLNEYLQLCLRFINQGETYAEMATRLTESRDIIDPSNQNGRDLKQTRELLVQRFVETTKIQNKIKQWRKILKARDANKSKRRIVNRDISKAKKEIRVISDKYKIEFNKLLKQTQSADAINIILYNYKNNLPHEWIVKLIMSLTNIPDDTINRYINNRYYDSLIHPSIDLYVCSKGYPCGEKDYLMYFQCLGLKHKPNENACNKSLQSYYFSDFLTENMQYDIFRIIGYLQEYANE